MSLPFEFALSLLELLSLLEYWGFFVAPYWFGAPCFVLVLPWRCRFSLKALVPFPVGLVRPSCRVKLSFREFVCQSQRSSMARASLGVSFPSAHPDPGVHFTQAFPGLIRSALKVFHLFSGLLLLEPIEFISSRSAHGISPSELSPLRDWSLLSKSLTLLLLAAALTGCLALPVLPRVLQRQVCSSASGFCSLLKLVHIKSGFRWLYGRCSLGFQTSLRVLFLCKRPHWSLWLWFRPLAGSIRFLFTSLVSVHFIDIAIDHLFDTSTVKPLTSIRAFCLIAFLQIGSS